MGVRSGNCNPLHSSLAQEDSLSWGKKWNRSEKYGGSQKKKIEHAGHWFDSKLEASLFDLLALRERGGEISALTHQPGTVFLSSARIQYRPDFRYFNKKTGEEEYAEAKGFPNDKWPMKKKLWKTFGPGTLHIYMGSYRSLKLTETIVPLDRNSCPHCGKEIAI